MLPLHQFCVRSFATEHMNDVLTPCDGGLGSHNRLQVLASRLHILHQFFVHVQLLNPTVASLQLGVEVWAVILAVYMRLDVTTCKLYEQTYV